ncbi:MAG: hypothetical protein AAF385_00735 [Pseudomonadota bacterium]
MSFRPNVFPELRDMSVEDGRRIVEIIIRRRPAWFLAVLAVSVFLLLYFVKPIFLALLHDYFSYRSAEFFAIFACVVPAGLLHDQSLRRFWIRPEIRRIRGPKPNSSLQEG